MAWIESHQEVGRHPKTRKAARRLGIGIPQMVGHLHLLWHWALDYADTGDLGAHDNEDVALGAMWDGDPDEFVQVLIDVGYIDDPGRTLHHWMDYAGRLVADRIRKREQRAAAVSTDSPRTVGGQSVDRPRARTVPNPTNQEPSATAQPPQDEDDRFDEFWQTYPARNGKKVGKANTRLEWVKLNAEQRQRAIDGARNLAASDQMPKDPERFLRRPKGGKGDWPFDDWQEAAQTSQARDGPPPPRQVIVGSADWERRQAEQRDLEHRLLGEPA